MELWDLMKKVQMFNSRCSTMQVERCSKKSSNVSLDQLAQSSELQGGSSEQTECNQKLPVVCSTEQAPVMVKRCL